MTTPVTSQEIQQLHDWVNSGNIDGAYDYLSDKGYNYASWADGVAQEDTIAGLAALDFLNGTAVERGIPLSQETIQAIKHDMAEGYLDALKNIANNNPDGSNTVNRDIKAKEVWDFHKDAFEKNGLSIENWTLNTPFELAQRHGGEEGLERFWGNIRETGGSGMDALLGNFGVLQGHRMCRRRRRINREAHERCASFLSASYGPGNPLSIRA